MNAANFIGTAVKGIVIGHLAARVFGPGLGPGFWVILVIVTVAQALVVWGDARK